MCDWWLFFRIHIHTYLTVLIYKVTVVCFLLLFLSQKNTEGPEGTTPLVDILAAAMSGVLPVHSVSAYVEYYSWFLVLHQWN